MAECSESDLSFDNLLTESDCDESGDDLDDFTGRLVIDKDSLDEDEDEEEEKHKNDEIEENSWSSTVTVHDPWVFQGYSGADQHILDKCKEPIDFYCFFLNNEVINHIVAETNRYGQQKEPGWRTTDANEFKKFMGLCLQMGIVKLPKLRDYWSSRPVFGENPIGSKVMPRNRFEKLQSYLHFSDNDNYDSSDRLHKISPLIKLLNTASEGAYKAGRDICIDESLVPFRGRIFFRQYIPNKSHKYGIKLFKLCTKGGYTYRIIVYARKDTSRTGSVAESVVLKLMDGLTNEGRHLYVDNWYNSVPLAEKLIMRKTHLIGTCRKNRRGLPKKVIEKKLKRGEVIAQQNNSGITVMKWRDKRDVLMLSTTHDASMSDNGKPMIIQDYNKAKLFVDTSDQMASYYPYIRKTSKWYIRLFYHLYTQTALVNAWKLFNDHVQNIKLIDFKIAIIESLLDNEKAYTPTTRATLEETAGPKAITRKKCFLLPRTV